MYIYIYIYMYVCIYIYIYIYIYTYEKGSANKNAKFSQLVSAMGSPHERRLFINIYRCLQNGHPFFFYYDIVVL